MEKLAKPQTHNVRERKEEDSMKGGPPRLYNRRPVSDSDDWEESEEEGKRRGEVVGMLVQGQ